MSEQESLDDLIDQLENVKLREKAVADKKSKLQTEILDRLESAGVTSAKTPTGRTVTRVQSTTKSWDVDTLKDILVPLGIWDHVKVVREEFDLDKLGHLVAAGRVDEEALLPAFEVRDNKPYPKVTGKKKR